MVLVLLLLKMKKNKEEVESNLYDPKTHPTSISKLQAFATQLSSHTRACVGSFWPWDSAPGQLAPPWTAGHKSCLFFYGGFFGEFLVAQPWRFCCGQFHHDASLSQSSPMW